MGTGIGHYIPLVAYLGFWVMCVVSLTGKPLYGLYYMIPFVPYRTMRDHFVDYPLGGNMLTLLVISIILGALIAGKRLPKSKLYLTWLVFGIYLYFSMWIGVAMGNEPAPLWLSDINFLTWKDYMLIPLLFVAAGLVIEDRKAVRNVILLTAIAVFLVDRSSLLEELSHNIGQYDESKRESGPLAYGSNQLAAFLAQFAMFFWGFTRVMKRRKVKLFLYALVALTVVTDLYTYSRGSYLALIGGAAVLALFKDRKLIPVLILFLFTWQVVVPASVTERVSMTHTADGKLEASAEERVVLWEQSERMFLSSPLFGTGYASFQFGDHIGSLKDTHNWFIKVAVETGILGSIIALVMLSQMLLTGYRLFRRGKDPLYIGLGLGFLCSVVACIIANCFGDRWTYLEITGLIWILAGACVRALSLAENVDENPLPEIVELSGRSNPYTWPPQLRPPAAAGALPAPGMAPHGLPPDTPNGWR